ncbi:hypothetical protein, partial [Caldifermentibacillus hisashii]|uniref:hypothetical protein n=1 Tax=Caldifermentibacillus hisashii TaxID=996558 RepID=UPI001C10E3EB
FVTQRPLSPHFSVIPVGKIFFSVFSILWESRNNEHRNYLYQLFEITSLKLKEGIIKLLQHM